MVSQKIKAPGKTKTAKEEGVAFGGEDFTPQDFWKPEQEQENLFVPENVSAEKEYKPEDFWNPAQEQENLFVPENVSAEEKGGN